MIFRRLIYQSLLWRGVYLISLFLLNVLLSRLFGAAGCGWIFYLSSIYAFFILLCSFSLETSIGFYHANRRIPVSNIFALTVVWTLIAGLSTWVLAGVLFKEYNEWVPKTQFVWIGVSFVTGNLLISFFTALFYAEKKPALPNLILSAVNVLLIVAALVCYYAVSVRDTLFFINIYFHSFLAAGLLIAIVFAWRRGISALKWPSATDLKHLLRYSSMAFAANLISFVLFRVDYFFVNRYCDEDSLGNYIQVSKIVQLFFVMPGILASAVFPLTASGQRSQVNSYLPVLSRAIMLVSGVGCVGLGLAGKWLFPAIFGESFDSMYLPFLLMVPGLLAICLIYPMTSYYAGKDRIGENIKGSLIATVFLIIGDLLVVPYFGINGAALICSLSYLLYGGYMINRFRKEYRVAAGDFFIVRKSDLYLFSKLLKVKNGEWR